MGPHPVTTRLLESPPGAAGRSLNLIPCITIWSPKFDRKSTGRPLLVYFPGWPGTTVDNRILVQCLASVGYVVATFTYAPISPTLWPSGLDDGSFDQAVPMDFSSAEAFQDTVNRAERGVRRRAADAVAFLDRLQHVLPGETGENVGIFGYSFGGAVAAQACWADARFKAGLNLDGWHFGDAAQHGVRQPYLYLSDDTPLPTSADLDSDDPTRRFTASLTAEDQRRLSVNIRRHGATALRIRGTDHAAFCDSSLLRWNPPRWSALRIITAVTTGFFDHHFHRSDVSFSAVAARFSRIASVI